MEVPEPRTVGVTTATFAPEWAAGSLLDVEYPGRARYDTHTHEGFYLGLVVCGRYREWRPALRDVQPTELVEYVPGSRHAVRVEQSRLRILHLVTGDRDGVRWSPALVGLLWQMARELERPRPRPGPPYQRTSASRLTLESLLAEALSLEAGSEAPGRGDPSWLRPVRERLRDAPGEHVGLRDLAALAGVHPAHLARTFRARHGMTAGEFLRRLRVARAVREVQSSERPLSHIALDAGFADQSHFGRFFRRYVGATPARLRAGHVSD